MEVAIFVYICTANHIQLACEFGQHAHLLQFRIASVKFADEYLHARFRLQICTLFATCGPAFTVSSQPLIRHNK